MITILEGPDGAGKTTLAKSLARLYDAEYVHFGPPSPKGAWADYVEKLAFFEQHKDKHFIIDRFIYGERAYGPVFRKDNSFTLAHQRMLERVLLSLQARLIICLPSYDACYDNWANRAGELITDTNHFQAIYHFYEQLMHDVNLPFTHYDYVTGNPSIDALVVGLNPPSPNEGPGIGHFYCRGQTMLVGDVVNLNATHHNWPFVARGGSSLWLTEELETARVKEGELYWVNAFDYAGHETDGTFLDRLKPDRVIALGEQADLWCRKQGIQAQRTFHPAYWKRFRQGEPYPLVDLLRN